MGAINAVTDLTAQGDVAVLTVNSPPVNALSQQVRDGIVKGMQQAIADAAVKAVVLICDGRTFIAGADITEFGKPPQAPSLHDVCDTIENSPKPVVAAIHGTALGGGLETALCCHYRVAVPSAKCGLPEVHLGLLPGAGGTQRLPRIVGPEQALEMVTSGEHVDAKTRSLPACSMRSCPKASCAPARSRSRRKSSPRSGRCSKVREMNEKVEAARGKPELFAEFRKANARKFRGFLAPEYNIRCIEAAVNLPFDEGIATERKLFMELMTGTQSAAQRYVFFAERQVWKMPDVPEDTPTIPVKKVGIIGAGTMGGGIAMNFANIGMPVTHGRNEAGRARPRLRRDPQELRDDREARQAQARGRREAHGPADRHAAAANRWRTATSSSRPCSRTWTSRKRCSPSSIASSSRARSSRPTRRASTSTRSRASRSVPSAVIGLHFFSPANVMRLLEIVRAQQTSKPVIATSMQLAKKIGKIAALVGVCPGFVGNRILYARQQQAQAMLMEGAMPWDIDKVLYDFGLPMGPFAMSDLAGLDIGWSKEKSSELDGARSAVRDGPPRPEDRRRLLRLRRRAQRQAFARHREDHQGLHGQSRRDAAQDLRSRKSSSAACIR